MPDQLQIPTRVLDDDRDMTESEAEDENIDYDDLDDTGDEGCDASNSEVEDENENSDDPDDGE